MVTVDGDGGRCLFPTVGPLIEMLCGRVVHFACAVKCVFFGIEDATSQKISRKQPKFLGGGFGR